MEYALLCFGQVAFGRISTLEKGACEISLFILKDGRKIEEQHKQDALCDSLLRELTNPLRVSVVTRGPDTELLVATPIEACGRGRPRVLFDVTHALMEKPFGICIFKVSCSFSQTCRGYCNRLEGWYVGGFMMISIKRRAFIWYCCIFAVFLSPLYTLQTSKLF